MHGAHSTLSGRAVGQLRCQIRRTCGKRCIAHGHLQRPAGIFYRHAARKPLSWSECNSAHEMRIKLANTSIATQPSFPACSKINRRQIILKRISTTLPRTETTAPRFLENTDCPYCRSPWQPLLRTWGTQILAYSVKFLPGGENMICSKRA